MRSFLSIVMLTAVFTMFGQGEGKEHTSEESENKYYRHYISLYSGSSVIFKYVNEDFNPTVRLIPTVGFDYWWRFHHRFGVGIITDLELANYLYERDDQSYVRREFALVATPFLWAEVLEGWSFILGPGVEVEKHESFFLIHVGTELVKKFNNGWEAGINISTDIKKVNTSLNFGLVINKAFKLK